MDLAEKDAYIEKHLMKLQPDTLRFMVVDLTAEVERLTSEYRILKEHYGCEESQFEQGCPTLGELRAALTLSRAEGRREGMKQAELIAEGMQGTVSMFLHAEDCTAHNVACRQIAAAIREAAQEKDNNEKKEKV